MFCGHIQAFIFFHEVDFSLGFAQSRHRVQMLGWNLSIGGFEPKAWAQPECWVLFRGPVIHRGLRQQTESHSARLPPRLSLWFNILCHSYIVCGSTLMEKEMPELVPGTNCTRLFTVFFPTKNMQDWRSLIKLKDFQRKSCWKLNKHRLFLC